MQVLKSKCSNCLRVVVAYPLTSCNRELVDGGRLADADYDCHGDERYIGRNTGMHRPTSAATTILMLVSHFRAYLLISPFSLIAARDQEQDALRRLI